MTASAATYCDLPVSTSENAETNQEAGFARHAESVLDSQALVEEDCAAMLDAQNAFQERDLARPFRAEWGNARSNVGSGNPHESSFFAGGRLAHNDGQHRHPARGRRGIFARRRDRGFKPS